MAADDHRPFGGGDRAAERMHRHAERMHQRAERMRNRMNRQWAPGGGPPVFFGVVLLVLGALFLLDNLDIVETRAVWRSVWPLIFIGWGTSRLIAGHTDRFLPWLAVGGGTVLLGNSLFGWRINLASLFWPLILIGFGAHILYRAWRRPLAVHASTDPGVPPPLGAVPPDASADPTQDSSSTFRDSAFLGSVERRNVSQAFRGGDASTFMGSVEIDLRDCRMASAEAVVDVSAMLGSIELRIPRGWIVESRVSATLGSFEDLTAAPIEPSANRLVVRGSAFMGSVEIRN